MALMWQVSFRVPVDGDRALRYSQAVQNNPSIQGPIIPDCEKARDDCFALADSMLLENPLVYSLAGYRDTDNKAGQVAYAVQDGS